MGLTRPSPTHVGWVGLDWTYVMGWVELNFFLPNMVGWVKKSPQPNPCTPLFSTISSQCKFKKFVAFYSSFSSYSSSNTRTILTVTIPSFLS